MVTRKPVLSENYLFLFIKNVEVDNDKVVFLFELLMNRDINQAYIFLIIEL